MKKQVLSIFALAIFPGALVAQDLAGNWQGTLNAGRELRVVFKIAKGDGATPWKALFYPNIDQPGPAVAVGAITIQNGSVKLPIPGMGGSFEGKLNPEGNVMTGNWIQGPSPLPLTLTRATQTTAWTIPEPPPAPKAMAPDANPTFAVATIKPSAPDRPGKAIQIRPGQFITINTTLSDLITFVYGLHPKQIVGAPEWVDTDKFDLTGKPDGEGQPNGNQWKTMVEKLLADRFALKFHRDKKELSVFALSAGKTPNKLTPSTGDPNGLPGLFFRGLGNLPARNATMKDFAGILQSAVLDRPVVDQTGITGRYDFELKWTPDETQFPGLGGGAKAAAAAAEKGDAPPDLFTAVQQQLPPKCL
jgi:uncharacterized protein (TIGR03435 family)